MPEHFYEVEQTDRVWGLAIKFEISVPSDLTNSQPRNEHPAGGVQAQVRPCERFQQG
jgi:hypothetical protein